MADRAMPRAEVMRDGRVAVRFPSACGPAASTFVEGLGRDEAMALAADLIAAATGYEPVNEDGEYLTGRGAPNPHYRVMRLVSVDHVAECLSPADRETYLRGKGRPVHPLRTCSFCGGPAGRHPPADGYRCADCAPPAG